MYIKLLNIQVKNMLDRREYAMKKIYLSEKDLPNCFKVRNSSTFNGIYIYTFTVYESCFFFYKFNLL